MKTTSFVLAPMIWLYGILDVVNGLPNSLAHNVARRATGEDALKIVTSISRRQNITSDSIGKGEFDPSQYQNFFPIGRNNVWIAVNYGPDIARWLVREAVRGLRSDLNSQIAQAGGNPSAPVGSASVVTYYSFPWSMGIFLNFALEVTNYGIHNFDWNYVIDALRDVGLATVSATPRLFNEYVLYIPEGQGRYLTLVSGFFREETFPSNSGSSIDLTNLTQPAGLTLTSNGNANFDDVSSLPGFDEGSVDAGNAALVAADTSSGTVATS